MPSKLTYAKGLLHLATAYKAKLLCSGIFVSNREAQSLLAEDLAVDSLAPLRYLNSTIDRDRHTVTVSCFGLGKQTALYRPGLGSTLVLDTTSEELREQSAAFSTWYQQNSRTDIPLPVATALPAEVNEEQLSEAIAHAFSEPHPKKQQRTRAVVALYKGEVIAERYAEGFSKATPLLGWSMAKSVVNTLIGILVQQGKLSLDAKDLLLEWQSPNDPRRHITLDQLLRMSSGLQFSEEYANPLSDVTTMLFRKGDRASYAAQCPLATSPGSSFHYASGTTILLCRIIREALGGALTDYLTFPRRTLFDRLGMASAILEPDAAGIFTGSSFMYATANDWAKLGLLYLQDGCWLIDGKWERILPARWVQYSASSSGTDSCYGAHFWRGVPLSFTAENQNSSEWPKDAYLASGYQGQFLTIIPSKKLVVVRLGLSQRRNSWDHEQFINQFTRAFLYRSSK